MPVRQRLSAPLLAPGTRLIANTYLRMPHAFVTGAFEDSAVKTLK